MSQPTVIMGSCYMTKGEGVAYVKSAVERAAKQNVEMYFFDVICEPAEVSRASMIVDMFYQFVEELLPDLPFEKVFTGITCNQKVRPAAMALVVLHGGDVGIKDINPTREDSWPGGKK